MKSWLVWFDNWLLKRKLWKASVLLIECGTENGSVQHFIDNAILELCDARRAAEMRYKAGGEK